MALDGVTGGKSGMFQVDVYAKTYTDADSLVDQIIDRTSSSGQFDVGGISELPDDFSSDTGDFRLSIELSVQF
ncbi:gp10 [Burkholderia lata]|uniref:Gp10 n=2 Tax=Burkholderia lata (strain ATCC 17760 / DSM 23089 / LMG 22485 / NCIMB 9086 / R18194 / 383) TaxID=482957 RepID=A0A6P2WG64_BURL3|nr:gp10 [Burkholderia lata]